MSHFEDDPLASLSPTLSYTQPRRKWIWMLLGVLSLSAAGLAWLMYEPSWLGTEMMTFPQEPPHRVIPQDDDRSVVQHQDKVVYEKMQPRASQKTASRSRTYGSSSPAHKTIHAKQIVKAQPQVNRKVLAVNAYGEPTVNRRAAVPVQEGVGLRMYAPPPVMTGQRAQSLPSSTSAGSTVDEDDDDWWAEDEPIKIEKAETRAMSQKTAAPVTKALKSHQAPPASPVKPVIQKTKKSYHVQLVSVHSHMQAEAELVRLKGQYPGVLDRFQAKIVEVDLGQRRGTRYRVYLGPFMKKDQANQAQSHLSSKGLKSLVIQG